MHLSNKRVAALAGVLVLALAFIAPPASKGDGWNLLTRFSVNHEFEVPGAVLEANTPYVMKLLDSPSTRNVVQVYDKDETKLLAMFIAASAQRMEPEDRTVFKFIEVEPGFPMPIRTWFYPGRLNGLDFIYPKDQATEIAAHAKEPVLATDSDVKTTDLSTVTIVAIPPGTAETTAAPTATAANVPTVEESEQGRSAENEQVAPEENAQIAQNQNEGEFKGETEVQREKPVEQPNVAESSTAEPPAAVEQPAPAEQPSTPEQTRETKRLPQTAGELPLLGLVGILCLGVGLGLKVLSARS